MSPHNCNQTLSPCQDGDDESERVPTGEVIQNAVGGGGAYAKPPVGCNWTKNHGAARLLGMEVDEELDW